MPTTSAEIEWSPTLHAILGADPGSQLYGQISVWFHKLQLFRRGENERIFRSRPTAEDVEIHRRLLVRLIADGEHLALVIKQNQGLIKNPENIKAEDLEAALEALRNSYRGAYDPVRPERREQVLNEVFKDVTQPAHRSDS